MTTTERLALWLTLSDTAPHALCSACLHPTDQLMLYDVGHSVVRVCAECRRKMERARRQQRNRALPAAWRQMVLL